MKQNIPIYALLCIIVAFPMTSNASDDVTQTGRYTDYSLDPQVELLDPLEVVINVRLPNGMNYVGEAIEYLLQRSGYQITKDIADAPPEMFVLFSRFLPAQQKNMGTVRLQKALEILAGSAYLIQINHVTREVSFKLKEEYSTFLEGINLDDYKKLWSERLSRDSAAEIRLEDGTTESVSGKSDQVLRLPNGQIQYGPVHNGETLGEIAKTFTSDSTNMYVVMLGIFNANKNAFIAGNMNKLRASSTLIIPSGEKLASIDSVKAEQVTARHYAEYLKGRVQ